MVKFIAVLIPLLLVAGRSYADPCNAKRSEGMPPIVCDSGNQFVGVVGTPGVLYRKISGTVLALNWDTTGFEGGQGFVEPAFFLTSNCSGQEYISLWDGEGNAIPVNQLTIMNGIVTYPAPPYQTMQFQSGLDNGNCMQYSNGASQLAGAMATFDLNSLGLVPPFSVK
jgi:hypothetical protein